MTTPALTRLFKEFFDSEKAGGLILVACTILSILLTNTGAGEIWLHFWHSLEHGVNDGLMAIFFLLVGLEIERELYIGELADFKKALLPIIAAIGGMLIPAGIHFFFNHGSPTQSGIGIPMATDIAFALGVLSLLGNKVPASVKIFLTALAIIDDLGAIIVIAIFYTKTLSFAWLAFALGIFLVLLLFNRLKVNKLVFYIIPGILLWYCMLRSGIHATLSGVLLAFAIPFRKASVLNPSETVQHALHKPVAFLILPLFALANTGILLSTGWTTSLGSSNSLGILSGLVLGKPLGILLCCWLAIRTGLCRLPEDIRWSHLLGMSILAGIGFTMSIFITNLAFDDAGVIQFSKIAILVASLLASVLGFSILSLTTKLGTVFP
ncbi:MAG TPA: Na+/H+ antiporter NhaA [Puia sp.]|nr:Na+/H+ antiporter NhaA [Puia sp.]